MFGKPFVETATADPSIIGFKNGKLAVNYFLALKSSCNVNVHKVKSNKARLSNIGLYPKIIGR